MNYNKLNEFPEYRNNPFLEETLKIVSGKTRNKREFVKGNRSIVNTIVDDKGMIVGHSAFVQNKKVDEDQFIKLYVNGFSVFYELTVGSRKVLGYIIQKCIVPNRDIFFVDFEEAKEFTGYTGENSIRSGLAGLMKHKLIARSKSPYKYFLNPMIIFNGNRISFIQNIIKNQE